MARRRASVRGGESLGEDGSMRLETFTQKRERNKRNVKAKPLFSFKEISQEFEISVPKLSLLHHFKNGPTSKLDIRTPTGHIKKYFDIDEMRKWWKEVCEAQA